jgi:hypothetical protein
MFCGPLYACGRRAPDPIECFTLPSLKQAIAVPDPDDDSRSIRADLPQKVWHTSIVTAAPMRVCKTNGDG